VSDVGVSALPSERGDTGRSHPIQIRIPQPMLTRIDRLDHEGCISRNEKIRLLLASALQARGY
jgi:metal-responsive CopG/Arc/MetJ family transcriptional regulator